MRTLKTRLEGAPTGNAAPIIFPAIHSLTPYSPFAPLVAAAERLHRERVQVEGACGAFAEG